VGDGCIEKQEERDRIPHGVTLGGCDQGRERLHERQDRELKAGCLAQHRLRRQLQHRYWHFIDMPFSPDNTPLDQPEAPNAQTQIIMLRDAISSPSTSDDVKSYDVAWLIHLVGDVHQPMQATSRFTQSQTSGDRGGNDVKICTPSCGKALHAYWDDALGTSNKPETARQNAGSISPADQTLASVTDVATWINESLEAAKNTAYADPPIGVGAGPFTLTSGYKTAAKDVAKQRAALAGARLAKLLNDALH